MASIVIAGGGIAALTTAMLLADDGHSVTVLERDPAAATDPCVAWDSWERRGVSQFRLPHLFVSRFRVELERELPRVAKALDDAGALRFNVLNVIPRQLVGEQRDGDDEYEMLTGRRPVMEATIASLAESTPGINLRRGVSVSGFVAARRPTSSGTSALHVNGVYTDSGEQLAADLVVDATGRRSPLARWLRDGQAAAPDDEIEDSGFRYFCRHFRSGDGALPPMPGPPLQEHETVSSLTLPADNGTWAVVIVASATDSDLRGLHDVARWSAAVRAMPLIAHWIDAEPLDDRIVTMAGIEDRHRSLIVDGEPVAPGLVTLADAWACTNPSMGRGVSLGTVHGRELRDTLRRSDSKDARQFALDFHEATMKSVEPWYRATVRHDRHRLAEINAHVRGQAYEADDPEWASIRGIQAGSAQDPDLLRCNLTIVNTLRTPEDVLSQTDMRARAEKAGSQPAPAIPGPSRSELLAIAAS